MVRLTFCLILFWTFKASAQVVRYERETVREKLLQHLKTPPHVFPVHVGEFQSGQAREFFNYFKDVVQPQFNHSQEADIEQFVWHLLLDSATYRDEAEKILWTQNEERASDRCNTFAVSEEFSKIIKHWADLSRGLEGDLPKIARRLQTDREMGSFAPELKPKLDELDKLSVAFRDAQNMAPSNSTLPEFMGSLQDAFRRFKDKEISFAEAQAIIDHTNRTKGYRFVGVEAVKAQGEALNRMAVLRTELARSKGFKTWAEYRLFVSGQGYDDAYRGPAAQRKFLLDVIEALAPSVRRFYERKAQQLGIPPSSLRAEYLRAINLAGTAQLKPYFPAERITEIWQETMLESGFEPHVLNQIIVDDAIRPHKNVTGAYMAPLKMPFIPEMKIDAGTLNVIHEAPDHPGWTLGQMYILQNYSSGGLEQAMTAFHEGGHALEYLQKLKDMDDPEGYGYVETASTTMEAFGEDPEFLFHKAVPFEGKKPSLEEIKTMVANEQLNQVPIRLQMASSALFDMDLWDYDYTKEGAQTYLERAESLSVRNDELTLAFPAVDGTPKKFFALLATSHFVSGEVRNIGYSFAELSSTMMAEFISDEIEKLSGRRTWLHQPQLASLFRDRFFRVGWKEKFPTNIETITQRKFDPTETFKNAADRLNHCADLLIPAPK